MPDQPLEKRLFIQQNPSLGTSSPNQNSKLNQDIADITETKYHKNEASEIQLEEQKIKLEEQKIKLEKQKIKLEDYRHEVVYQRTLRLVQQSLRGSAGIVMLGVGLFFTSTETMIGPYMMGIGVAAISTSVKETAESMRSPSNNSKLDE